MFKIFFKNKKNGWFFRVLSTHHTSFFSLFFEKQLGMGHVRPLHLPPQKWGKRFEPTPPVGTTACTPRAIFAMFLAQQTLKKCTKVVFILTVTVVWGRHGKTGLWVDLVERCVTGRWEHQRCSPTKIFFGVSDVSRHHPKIIGLIGRPVWNDFGIDFFPFYGVGVFLNNI